MFDKNLMMADEQTLVLTAAAATLGLKSIALGAAGTDTMGNSVPYDPNKGLNVELLIQIVTTFLAAGGAANVTFELVMADNEALDSNLTVLKSSGAIAKATLVAGYKVALGAQLPLGIIQAFLGVRVTVDTNDGTAGAFDAALVLDQATSY